MKSPTLYFSAYPLKAITEETSAKPTQHQSPYLKAILSGKTRNLSRVRVFPMANPYPKVSALRAPKDPIPKVVRPAKEILGSDKDWFRNYE